MDDYRRSGADTEGLDQQNRSSEEPGAQGQEFPALGTVVSIVRQLTLGIAMVIWAVIGFLFWIPMMCYAIARFSALVVYTTIVNVDPSSLSAHLEHSMQFYFQGFRNILRAMHNKQQPHSSAGLGFEIDSGVVIAHVLGTVVFWSVIVLLILWWSGVILAPNE